MKFAQPYFLFGTAVPLVVAALLVAGGLLLLRAIRRFGDEAQVTRLVTGRAGVRRAIKGVLLVLGVAFGFIALAQPQYGRGTRLVPATDLDVVIVLDYSKSMFARDVPPSRILRAKSEVGQLISEPISPTCGRCAICLRAGHGGFADERLRNGRRFGRDRRCERSSERFGVQRADCARGQRTGAVEHLERRRIARQRDLRRARAGWQRTPEAR